STAAVAANYERNSWNDRNAWQETSATAPQVQSTRAGNPHRDAGYASSTLNASQKAKMRRDLPNEPSAQNANQISSPSTRAGDPHRDPANARSAYYDASADMSDRNP